MINLFVFLVYFLIPAWGIYLIFGKPKRVIVFGVPLMFLSLIFVLLVIDKQKVAESFGIILFFLLLESIIFQLYNEKF